MKGTKFSDTVLTLCVWGDKLYLKRTNFSKWDTCTAAGHLKYRLRGI